MKRIKLVIEETVTIQRTRVSELFVNDEDLPEEGLYSLESCEKKLLKLEDIRIKEGEETIFETELSNSQITNATVKWL